MIDQLKLIRDAGAVTRFHTSRVRPQRLSEHSHGVAEIILAVRPKAPANLLVAALRHDVYELFTGDIPAPTKWNHSELNSALNSVEGYLDTIHQLLPGLHTADALLLKWADMVELVLYTFEELKGGNTYAKTLMHNGLTALRDYRLDLDDAVPAKTLLDSIREEITLWTHAN